MTAHFLLLMRPDTKITPVHRDGSGPTELNFRPFMRQQFNEPRLVLNLFIQNSRCKSVRPGIFAERHITDRAPASNRATLGFEQQSQDVHCGWRVRQLRRPAPCLVVEFF
jgi:hypothetical protein